MQESLSSGKIYKINASDDQNKTGDTNCQTGNINNSDNLIFTKVA
jgi:hypothetical protein